MRRVLIGIALLFAALLFGQPVHAQYTLVQASKIMANGSGTKLLPSGKITFTPSLLTTDDAPGFLLPNGGQGTVVPVTCLVVNGVITTQRDGSLCQLPDTKNTVPLNLCFRAMLTDAAGKNLWGVGYSCLQPTGASLNLDNLRPDLTALVQKMPGIVGPQGPPGCDVTTASCHAVVVSDPDIDQAVVQPSGTTISFNSLNNVLWADRFPGGDIGARINAAIAARSGQCGTVAIAPGNYSFATPIIKPRCITIDASNAQLTWTGSSTTAAISTGSVAGIDYTWGGIKHLRLIGQGVGAGLMMGSSAGGYTSQAGVDDYLEKIEDVTVTNFADNIVKGLNAYQNSFIGGASTSGQHSNFFDAGAFGSENMNFFGWQSLNGAGWGFYSDDIGGGEYNFTNCSFDYNLKGAIYFMNGDVRIQGGHFEHAVSLPFIDSPVSPAGVRLTISGGVGFAFGGTPPSSAIRVRGTNSAVFIGQGLNIFHPGGALTSLVDWESAGQSNQVNIEPYMDLLATNGVAMPALTGNGNYQRYRSPTYTQYVPTGEIVSAMTVRLATINAPSPNARQGMITTLNLGGVPPVYGLDCATSAEGWNGSPDTRGEADHYNCFPSTANVNPALSGSDYAHRFWSNNGSGYDTVGGFTRDGHVTAPNGYLGGWSGTCPTGHSLIVSNGIVTGCS